ncbi:hypothetical protein C0Q70_01703 [Pomacea canaliculata]|uniref:Uncharacterized protein n=1 Tax=Pomacea canaliculata TaxID=400727 RepID=A0A2T7Q075_POMCA|nr:hypothetical protein C0Q70_01703 [Pomacea canaliculata]
MTLTYIKETKQIIAAGIGLLKYYSLSGIESASSDAAKAISLDMGFVFIFESKRAGRPQKKYHSSLESEVLHLQRLMGHGEHPNRIMVTTMDGGMKFLSPVTGSPLGFMYPVISLEKIDVFVYSAFRRNIYMLLKSGSTGSDNTVKLWYLRCYFTEHGPELAFHILAKITALDKCPLVGIFATSSLDGTVKIWGNDFQLVRELVYFVPLLSLCFVSNRGDLLVGKENVIILCQVEKYLPRHRLEDLITRNFEDEHKEPPLKFKEGVSSWINPAVMPKSAIPHCLRNQSRAAKSASDIGEMVHELGHAARQAGVPEHAGNRVPQPAPRVQHRAQTAAQHQRGAAH